MNACPPLEDIAAFLDGTLSPEERAGITEHLARCESCYEIFAGAVHFQEEESSADDDTGGRGVLPFPLAEGRIQEKHARVEPARPPRRVSRWLPLAASVVLATGLGYMIWQNSRTLPEVTVANLTEPLQDRPGLVDELYKPDVDRGLPREAAFFRFEAPAFLTGVYLVDLRLSIQAGKVMKTRDFLDFVSGELEQMELLVEPKTAAFFKERADQITDDPATLARLVQELPQKESALQNELAEEPFFRFGLWTEAGRLSAATKSPDFFEQRANRRFLSAIPREIRSEDAGRYGPILDDLRKIAPLWDRDEHSADDYEALARHFESIIGQFEQIQKQDQEDFDPLPAP